MPTYLTPHFTLEELTVTNQPYDNKPTGRALSLIKCVAYKLEYFRSVLAKPLYVNSCFRSREVNAAVGGVPSSMHLTGSAVDISIRNLLPNQLSTLESLIRESHPCEFIKYDTFVHVAWDFSTLCRDSPPRTWQEDYPDAFECAELVLGTPMRDL